MTFDHLASWTPVALDLARSPPTIDWGDLSGIRFSEPFFDQTVERWAGSLDARIARTELDVLSALDAAPALEPSALIFHLSRCGSTLLSRLLGTIPGMVVVSEPALINAFAAAMAPSGEQGRAVSLLRALVHALGRIRFGDETRYVLKLSSWNVTRLALYRRAFPRAAIIWLQRAPAEILASLLREPAGWMRALDDPALAAALFGISPPVPQNSDRADFVVAALAALLGAARDELPADALCLDYAELPDAVWTRVAPFLGWALDPSDIARMAEEARFDAREPARRAFKRAQTRLDPPPPALKAVAEKLLPLYRELDRRRVSQPAGAARAIRG